MPSKSSIPAILSALFVPSFTMAAPRITEVMAAGQSVIVDDDGRFPDWVEIHNPDAGPLNLAGWFLSDDPAKPDRWTFPAVTVAPGGYLVVFCSDRNQSLPSARPHANFRLNDGGETLVLSAPDRSVVHTLAYPLQLPDLSHDGSDYLAHPTPGAANDTVSVAIARAPEFSEPHGFKSAPFSLTLSSGTAGAVIRYTLDGTEPGEGGKKFTAPLRIAKTTVVRAAAFAGGMRRSPVVTRTYLFTADITKQSLDGRTPAGWPRSWGGNHVDYGLDPRIAAQGKFAPQLGAALKDIPSISIVMPLDDLFDPALGIYANAYEKGREWERAASLELIKPDGTPGFQANAGLRIRGGASRDSGNPKHSFRVLFRKEYGAEALEYPLFGAGGAKRTERFDLRCEQLVAWHYFVDPDTDFIRDIYGRDTQLALGQPASRGDFYHLYINGQYWGMYQTDERIGAEFAAEYFGGSESDYDTVKINYDNDSTGGGTDFVDGTFGAWRRAVEVGWEGFTSDVNYFRIQGLNADGTRNPGMDPLIDVDNLIDYMLAGIFIAADDSPPSFGTQNNWYSVRSRKGKFGFRFFAHDWEISMYNGDDNRVGPQPVVNPFLNGYGGPDEFAGDIIGPPAGLDPTSANPWHFWEAMRMNAEFRLCVADRAQRHFFNNGPLTQENATARWRARMDEINLAVIGESARWGDARQDDFGGGFLRQEKREGKNIRAHVLAPGGDEDDIVIDPLPGPPKPPGPGSGGPRKRPKPFTRDNWVRACNEHILDGFLANRTATVLQHLREGGLFPSIPAPSVEIAAGTVVSLADGIGPGVVPSPVIFFTLNGDDPRRVGGEVARSAVVYTGPFGIARRTTLKARTLHRGEWSALTERDIEPGVDFSALRITEIHYHPPGDAAAPGAECEFIELQNTGAVPLDLAGLRFTAGLDFSFPSVQLAAGQRVVIVGNAVAFEARHPGVAHAGQFAGRLSDDGESLTVETATGARVLSVRYADDGDWPSAPDGFGWSLVYDGTGDADDGGNWRASDFPGGSPGGDDPREFREAHVVISEVSVQATTELELENHEAFEVDAGGWKLRSGTTEISLPQPTLIPPLGRVSVPAGLALAAEGGGIALIRAPHATGPATAGAPGTSRRDHVHRFAHGPLLPGTSYGRYLTVEKREFFPMQISPTPGAENSGPLIPPLRISEIHYAPPGEIFVERLIPLPELPGLEFVEIENRLPAPGNLGGARLPGLGYEFPADAVIPAKGRALVVTGDPDAFRARHSVPAGVPIFGPASGALQDNGERVAIEFPVTAGGQPAFLTGDETRYNDRPPWPVIPPGSGFSLQRINAEIFAAEPHAWGAAEPTPGTANKVNAAPMVAISITGPDEAGRLHAVATAGDADGTVEMVELVVDGIVVAADAEAPFEFTVRPQPGLHDIAARATDERGGVGESETLSVEIAGRPDGFGRGLLASFYDGTEPVGDPVLSQVVPQVGGDWFHIPPPHLREPGSFAAVFTGTLVPRRSGIHSFNFQVAGGMRFFIRGAVALDAWTDAGTYGLLHFNHAIHLNEGEEYEIRVEYFDADGRAYLGMTWTEPDSFIEVPVPANLLYAPGLDSSALGVAGPPGIERTFLGRAVNARFTAMNASGAVEWSIESGEPPPGLSLRDDGRFGGTPTAAGVFAFVVRAAEISGDSPRSATCAVTMRIVDRKIAAPAVRVLTPGAIVNHSGDVKLSGTAGGPRPVAWVRYSVNGNAWHALPGGPSWSVLLPAHDALGAGDNYLQVQAEDEDGRLSPIIERVFSRRFPGTLRVTIEGAGTVSPSFLGLSTRIVGQSYTITATPAPGYLFSHWGDLGFAREPRLSFVMQENMSIIAVFAPNPFLGAGGRFSGFLGEGERSHLKRGRMSLAVAESGAYTGAIRFAGVRYPMKGRFTTSGDAYFYTGTPDGSRYVNVNMHFDPAAGSISITIFASAGETFIETGGTLSRVPWSAALPCPHRGRWTMRMPSAESPPPAGMPAGEAHAALSITAAGGVSVIGRLPVGGVFSSSASVDENGNLAFFAAPLRGGATAEDESVSGSLAITSQRVPRITGTLLWAKANLHGGPKLAFSGERIIILPPPVDEQTVFAWELAASGSRHRPPGPNKLVLGYSDVSVVIGGADGGADFEKPARLVPSHAFAFTLPDANQSDVYADPVTGLVRGSFLIGGAGWKALGVVDALGDEIAGFAAGPDAASGGFNIHQRLVRRPANPGR